MDAPVHPGSIVILDCGGQYAHLIARRVREWGAFSEIRTPDVPAAALQGVSGVILSGGPQSVYDKGSPQVDPAVFAMGVPVLGICYGHQLIAHALGGTVTPGKTKEYGSATVTLQGDGGLLLQGLPKTFGVWMSHGDEVTVLPKGFTTVGSSGDCKNAAMADNARKIFGVQFHLEVVHTENGAEILRRFVGLCKHAPWDVAGYVDRIAAAIKREVGDRRVFMLVSGGVDSTVAFTLLNRVLGQQRVQGLLVDTGLMRKGEVGQICDAFRKLGIQNLDVEDASTEFFSGLSRVTDPEEKRKRIGDTFLEVQRRVSEELGLRMQDGWMLGQGTIYPDTIETGGTRHADQIKTHHNRVAAVQQMIDAGLVVEPLKDLYKDEVRRLGEDLGLPHELVWRHPFPGPGLGVRILCTDKGGESVADPIPGLPYRHVALPVRSVGVQGDGRTYRSAIAVFSATPCVVGADLLTLATTVPNAHRDYNRVLLCTSHAEPVACRGNPAWITRDRANLLREADAIVDEEMRAAGLHAEIWQFPVVLLPVGRTAGGSSIVLRPVESQDAMTANVAPLPEAVLTSMTQRLLDLPGVEFVFLDLTSKPPGTIEWE